MPDVANALKFQRKMVGIESAYLKQIAQYRRDTRRVLLDIIDRDGVSRAAVSQMQNEISSMSQQITLAAAQASKDTRYTVQNYTRKQLQLAKRAGLTDSTDLAPILNAGSLSAIDGEQSYMTNTSAWVSQLQTSLQVQAAKLRIANAPAEEITGRLLSETMADGRASVWSVSGNSAKAEETANIWGYGVGLLGAYLAIFNEQQPDAEYSKQAIATIDERTTDCCLRVHGQIKPIDEPFHLTGTPRYADNVQDPPFHWYCRSTEVLYNPAFEEFGIPTDKMRDMAVLELDARELTGRRSVIYPSHSTSRRAGALPSG